MNPRAFGRTLLRLAGVIATWYLVAFVLLFVGTVAEERGGRAALEIIVPVFGAVLFVLLYVTPSFTYRVRAERIDLSWKVVRWLPVWSRSVSFQDVKDVRLFEWSRDWTSAVAGAMHPGTRSVVIEFNRRRVSNLFARKLVVRPADPAAFIAEVMSRQAAGASV